MISLGIFLRRLDRGDLRLEHLVADRLARVQGAGGGGLPAQLRDHQRRVPARARRRRDRHRLRRSSRSAAGSGSALGRDRRQRLVALALHRRRDRRRPAAIVLVVAFVPESPVKTPSRSTSPARYSSRSRWSRLLVGADRGRELGLDVGPRRWACFAARGDPVPIWVASSCACPSRWSTCACSRTGPSLLDQHDAMVAGFAMFGSFVADPAVRPGAGANLPARRACSSTTASASARRRPGSCCCPAR